MKKINLTIELRDNEEIQAFESWIRRHVKVTDFIHLSDTKELYETDNHFKKITSEYYKVKKIRNDYINQHNK